jgi:hypothetical protein
MIFLKRYFQINLHFLIQKKKKINISNIFYSNAASVEINRRLYYKIFLSC